MGCDAERKEKVIQIVNFKKKTRSYINRTNSVMVSCLNVTTHTEEEPLGSKHFALNATYKVVEMKC